MAASPDSSPDIVFQSTSVLSHRTRAHSSKRSQPQFTPTSVTARLRGAAQFQEGHFPSVECIQGSAGQAAEREDHGELFFRYWRPQALATRHAFYRRSKSAEHSALTNGGYATASATRRSQRQHREHMDCRPSNVRDAEKSVGHRARYVTTYLLHPRMFVRST